MADDAVEIEGYLVKRTIKSGRSWKRRYFVLHGTVLTYFKHPDDAKPRGEVRISGSSFVKVSQYKANAMELSTNRQVLIICAESAAEQRRWLEGLQASIQLARELRHREKLLGKSRSSRDGGDGAGSDEVESKAGEGAPAASGSSTFNLFKRLKHRRRSSQSISSTGSSRRNSSCTDPDSGGVAHGSTAAESGASQQTGRSARAASRGDVEFVPVQVAGASATTSWKQGASSALAQLLGGRKNGTEAEAEAEVEEHEDRHSIKHSHRSGSVQPPAPPASTDRATRSELAEPGPKSPPASASPVPKPRPTHSFSTPVTTFEVDTRYSLIGPIGTGAYGVVVSVNDSKLGEPVAIKKVTQAFEDLVDAKRILREIKLLRHFDHENIIHITDLLAPRHYDDFEDIYIVSELMETDLHRVIYSKQRLTDEHIQYFIYQTLRALKYIHSANVIHRDLKPSNLLLNANCDLKVCDFGLARGLEDTQLALTEYVVTRWYRAPEIMLACREYTKAIDVWAVGCILAELLGRKPLFPGEDYIHQLQLITDVVGTPTEADMHFIRSEKAKRFMRNQPLRRRRRMATLYPSASSEALDLLEQMLQFNPDNRITVDEALRHPYLASLHQPDDEPVCDRVFMFDDNKPDNELRKRDIQDQILLEILSFHPEDCERFAHEARHSSTGSEYFPDHD